jgi:chromosome segregation ATPase
MSSTTYQIKSGKKKFYSSPVINRIDCNRSQINKEKDILISQLKSKIFELELHQKDFDLLNDRYKQLQNEIAVLNECKNHLQYEKQQKSEELNQIMGELQCENENLQTGFNDKLSENKKIYSQNNLLMKQIELKDVEIMELHKKLNDLENQLNRNDDDMTNLGKIIGGLTDMKNSQTIKISQLIEDNTILKQICQEQNECLDIGKSEAKKLEDELDLKNKRIQDLNSQIRVQAGNINNLQNQLNKTNSINLQYQNNLKDFERQVDSLKLENNNLGLTICKEKNVRAEENNENDKLNLILNDHEQEINQLNHDIETIKLMQQKASEKNNVLQDENTKLRNHIMILTEQNQDLINHMDKVIDEDEKMTMILNRSDRITSLLVNNRNTIDQSLNNLERCIQK